MLGGYECYMCGTTENLHRHHMLHGTANRKKADKYDLTVFLCWKHHMEVHRDPTLDRTFKMLGQKIFEETHTREEFIQEFGRNYL